MLHTSPFPREEVFEAWTCRDALVKWFGGTAGRPLSAAVDLRVGGAYRVTLLLGGERVLAVEGVFVEVTPPERLVYTWRWDLEDCPPSLVTVEFRDREGETEILLVHRAIQRRPVKAGALAQ